MYKNASVLFLMLPQLPFDVVLFELFSLVNFYETMRIFMRTFMFVELKVQKRQCIIFNASAAVALASFNPL